MGTPNWQRMRSRFNHDWLKNRYLQALGRWLNIADELIEHEGTGGEFRDGVLREWEVHRRDLCTLIATFEKEMSPVRLFDESPLSQCDDQTKAWLPGVISTLWSQRYSIQERIQRIERAATSADAAYGQLQSLLSGSSTPVVALRANRAELAAFTCACEAVAAALSSLPSEVQVV